jgi:hypothetical protein
MNPVARFQQGQHRVEDAHQCKAALLYSPVSSNEFGCSIQDGFDVRGYDNGGTSVLYILADHPAMMKNLLVGESVIFANLCPVVLNNFLNMRRYPTVP